MKKILFIKNACLLIIGFTLAGSAIAQKVYQTQVLDIRLKGTSNLHDWEMKAIAGASTVSFVANAGGEITSLSKMSFTLPAKNLKSGHTVMDNNTYKALNTSANPNISFVLTTATVKALGGNSYQLNCLGNMSIAGTVKQTNLEATAKYNPADKSFVITGVKKMKMTDYNVNPPKALLGTIKTGDEISISYNIKFNN